VNDGRNYYLSLENTPLVEGSLEALQSKKEGIVEPQNFKT
jgi:hypothetical protein